jgi:hypothetical protein
MLAAPRRRVQPIMVREATPNDMHVVLRMRQAAVREFVGVVAIPIGLTWFVAVRDETIVACLATGIAPGRALLITDLYDDGTRDGKRGLVCLFADLARSRAKIYANVPLDRPGLRAALERRGAKVKGWALEYGT